uniref:Glutamate--cysteine ligase n=1 Tax=Steinernema glaseri TaxID=37863 RepID=A0A1I7Z711_9BILA
MAHIKDTVLDSTFMQNILDHWKENGRLNFKLEYNCLNKDPNGYRLLVNDIPYCITKPEKVRHSLLTPHLTESLTTDQEM